MTIDPRIIEAKILDFMDGLRERADFSEARDTDFKKLQAIVDESLQSRPDIQSLINDDNFFNLDFIIELMIYDPEALMLVEPKQRQDKNFMKLCIEANSSSLSFASPEIQELCDGKDPVEALEAAIRKEKFESALGAKPAVKRKKEF